VETVIRKFYFVLAAALLSGLAARGAWADAQDAFRQGNAAYSTAKFPDAVTAYESARAQGLSNWILYYNLGNAYYKAGQLGKAVVNYERAFERHSNDRDVIYNLNLSSTKAGDSRLPTSALPALFWRLFYALSLNAITAFASLLLIFLCVGGGGFLLGRGAGQGDKLAALAVVFGISGIWLSARIYFAEQQEAVVVAPSADVRSGPNLSYPANFTVPEGHTVMVLEEQDPVSGWLEIGVPSQGLKGWVPDSLVEKV
jgi:tetratricopeptide (TPR) repeat protein